jgi:hypothetical protein
LTASFPLFLLSHLAFGAGVAALAVALGRRLAAWGAADLCQGQWGFPLALGLGALGSGASLLGAVGLLTPAGAVALAGGAAWIGRREWASMAGEVRRASPGSSWCRRWRR